MMDNRDISAPVENIGKLDKCATRITPIEIKTRDPTAYIASEVREERGRDHSVLYEETGDDLQLVQAFFLGTFVESCDADCEHRKKRAKIALTEARRGDEGSEL
jgi:hypothetical protein